MPTTRGPPTELDSFVFGRVLDYLDLEQHHGVLLHQAQTLDAANFASTDIDLDAAKEANDESVRIAADIVADMHADGKRIIVVGISFGALLVQDLLATQGNVADHYVIVAARLDSPDDFWMPLADGEGPLGSASLARLMGALARERYSELLMGVDLANVTYAYGAADDVLGPPTEDEIMFLEAAGAEVISHDGGHVDAISSLTGPALASALDQLDR